MRERAGIENRVKSLSATRFWRCAPRRPADEKTAPHVPPLSAASTAPPPTAAVPARFLSSHGERSDAAHRDSPHALPRGLRRAKRRRETPQPAQNTHHDAFQSFHAVPAGTAPRAARPPRSNRQRRPHRSAAANRRAQNALYRAPARPCGTGRKVSMHRFSPASDWTAYPASPPRTANPARFPSSRGERSDAAHRGKSRALLLIPRQAKRRRPVYFPASSGDAAKRRSPHKTPATAFSNLSTPSRQGRPRAQRVPREATGSGAPIAAPPQTAAHRTRSTERLPVPSGREGKLQVPPLLQGDPLQCETKLLQ